MRLRAGTHGLCGRAVTTACGTYSAIAASVCNASNLDFLVATGSEIPETGGGKPSLATFYEFLRDQNALLSDLKGQKTAALFLLDKDIDDFLKIQIRSSHVIYTRTYDLEGTLFRTGNLIRAAAAMAGLEENVLYLEMGDPKEWLRSCAERWKAWVIICIYCRKHNLAGLPGYRISSRVNRTSGDLAVGEVDEFTVNDYIRRIQAASGFDEDKFKRSYGAVTRMVNYLFRLGRHDEVFKGKWYSLFVDDVVRRIAAGREFDLRAVHAGLIAGLAMTIAYPNELTKHFLEAINSILAALI